MRVAYLHYLSGGDGALTHVREFSRAARTLGTDLTVHAVCGGGAVAAGDEAAPPGGRWPRWLARRLHEPKALAMNLRHLRTEARVVRDARPDVLLVRASLLVWSFVVTARRARIPLVVEVNAPVLESRVYKSQYAHLPVLPAAIERWTLGAADGVVAVSTSLALHLVERCGVRPDAVTVVANGADVERFRPDVLPADLPWGAAGAAGPTVGFIGSFQEFHGVERLARMMLRVAALRPATRFLLVGDGDGAETVLRLVRPLGARVHFTGRVPHEQVPGLVTAFDVGVLPDTAFYCSPLKVVEWMAAGRAVVAPDHPSLRDVIADGRDGVLVPPRDEERLVEAVIALVDDPRRRAALGAAARRRAVDELTWRENARRVLTVCSTAVARRAGGQPISE